jgi:hydroxymethylpyrimidine pyrophosphatase-like HAD family hydrolase
MSPVLQPANLMVITKKGVSKKDAVLKIAKDHSFDLSNSLGVGDHHSDWKFMSLCTYKGVMGNSTDKLKDLADQDDKACIGGVVDNDGLIDILDYFKL